MECIKHMIPETIPPEFANITLASTSFCKFVNILDHLEGEGDLLQKHTVIATTLGHLIEFHGDKLLRSTKLSYKAVTKVVIHHEFHPLQLYIVLLCSTHKAVVMSYNDFKILQEWKDISDIDSSDPEATGAPCLMLYNLAGSVLTISSEKLLSLSNRDDLQHEEMQKGKSDVLEALAQRLKCGIRHVTQLSSQKRKKEDFIAQKLLMLQSQLQGLGVPNENNLVISLIIDEEDNFERTSSASTPHPQPVHLKILNVRQKIVHDKWIIGLNVVNDADRLLVCNPQLVLEVLNGTDMISYTCDILKVVQRKQNKTEDDASVLDTKVTIEKLEPPILRPKKKACIIGVCDIPSFNEGSRVTCSGILSFTCKSLQTEETQLFLQEAVPPFEYQVSFEPVEIIAHELQKHFVSIEQIAVKEGNSYFFCL